MSGGSKWTDELVAEAARLLEAGQSRRSASEILGVPRCALTSAVNRLPALAKFRMTPAEAREARRQAANESSRRRYAEERAARPAPVAKPKPLPVIKVVSSRPPLDPDRPPAERKPLMDLGMTECHFPVAEDAEVVGRYWFCAEETGAITERYCERHKRRMYPARAEVIAR